jgi:hypothetical protein
MDGRIDRSESLDFWTLSIIVLYTNYRT